MVIQYKCIPYTRVGDFVFGMKREKIHEILGAPVSTQMYGFPIENRFLDDYDFFHILCNSEEKFEAIELFPDLLSDDRLEFIIDDNTISIDMDLEKTKMAFSVVTDDLTWHDDEEGYSSEKLGIKIYCPQGYVEDVIMHDLHCYDEENEYLEQLYE